MNREIGFGRKVLRILEDEHLSYEHIPSGIDHMSVILREKQLDSTTEQRVVERIKNELAVDDITVAHNMALIMVVGEGMQRTIGIACRITGALAKAKVNIEIINQGSSEVSIMLGIKSDDLERAINAIYDEFFR